MCIFPKNYISSATHLNEFDQLIREKYVNYTRLITDGSKSADGVGSAAVCEGVVPKSSLPQHTSIFSAELHAIHLALVIIRDHEVGS